MEKPSFDYVNALALEFAKVLDASDTAYSPKALSDSAMKKAIGWINNEESRKVLYNQEYPNWIDLQSSGLLNIQNELVKNKHYWIVYTPTMREGTFSVKYCSFFNITGPDDDLKLNFELGEGNALVNPFFILRDDDSKYFSEDKPPKLPVELCVEDVPKKSIYDNVG